MAQPPDPDPYAAPAFVGFSLWLVPSEPEVLAKLQAAIDTLSAKHHAIPFVPHVTLLGGLRGFSEEEMCLRTAALARQLKPYALRVDCPAWLPSLFFRCVFAKMHLDADAQAAFDAAKAVFDIGPDFESYMPHLSLVYSDMDDTTRARAADEVGASLDGLQFTVRSIQVWNTTGTHDSWRLVQAYDLSTE